MKLNITNAYYQLRIAKGDEWKIAFQIKYGHYKYTVMPFGLTNAPVSFQQFINKVLREYLDIFVIAYLNDILIFSNTFKKHVDHVTKILNKFETAQL